MQDDLGDRMKMNYEGAFSHYLPHHMPVIIRLDGKGFHNLTKRASKPFDHDLVDLMRRTTLHLCQEIDTVKLGYSQSDEISLLLHPYQKLNSQPWFGNSIQKIVSISAAMATAAFNAAAEEFRFSRERFTSKFGDKLPALFDARAFVVPECEIVNSFIWRQKDAIRNSISMHAQSVFSHKELHKKSTKDKIEMMKQKGIDHESFPIHHRRGFCVLKKDVETNGTTIRQKWVVDNEIPIFTENRKYIENAFFGEKDDMNNSDKHSKKIDELINSFDAEMGEEGRKLVKDAAKMLDAWQSAPQEVPTIEFLKEIEKEEEEEEL